MVQQRYILSSVIFLVSAVSYAIRSTFPLLLTQMVYIPNINPNDTTHNANDGSVCPAKYSNPHNDISLSLVEKPFSGDRYQWTQELQGIILSSLYFGTILSQIPCGILIQKFGPKVILCSTLFLQAVIMALSPSAVVYVGGVGLLVTRILMGISQGPFLPCLAYLIVTWYPIEERGRSSAIILMGSNAGGFVATFLIGLVIKQTGRWDLVFYGFAVIFGIASILFGLLCYDSPTKHPFINSKERHYLKSKTARYLEEEKKSLPPTPWRSIITSLPVIALIVASTLYHFAINVLVVASSKYLNDVLHIPIEENSIYNSVPRILNIFLTILVGIVSDWMLVKLSLSLTTVRKIFTVFSSILPALCIIGVLFSGCNETLAAILLMIATIFQSSDVASFEANAYDLCPNYIGPFKAYMFTIVTIGSISSSNVVGVLTPHAFLSEWQIVFWLLVTAYIFSAVVFIFWGTAKVQPWNSPKDTQNP